MPTRTSLRSLLLVAVITKAVGLSPACKSDRQQPSHVDLNRRSLLTTTAASFLALSGLPFAARAETAEVRGTKITPFNSLMFQYRGNDFGGLEESDIQGPSISYADFMVKLKAGDIDRVEFQAPDGDVAFCYIKGTTEPLRIGSGYPIEQHDGYSSPLFAVRAVKNAGVPYKFVVPALAKINK
jgi:hypothetical protein